MKLKNKKIFNHLDDLTLLKEIVEAGGDINRVDRKTKQNAVFFALENAVSDEVLDFLLSSGIRLNVQNKQGNSVIHQCEDLKKLAKILAYSPELNLKNKLSYTPIFKCNNVEKAKMLVGAGIDLNVLDDQGEHFLKTVNTMDFDLMKVFIDKGMNRFMEKRGLTLDTFFERWSSIETQAYFENKLKTKPELYKIKCEN